MDGIVYVDTWRRRRKLLLTATLKVKVRHADAWEVTQRVYRERGIKGFFRGGLFRSAWTALGSGLYLGTYDVAKVWLKRRNPNLDDTAGL